MRIGVIGLGMASKPHALALKELADRVEVAGAFSPTATRREEFAVRTGLPVTDDLDGLFTDGSVGGVMVLTPPATHLELVRRAAAAGKHVLLEKPLEVDTGRAAELVAVAADAGITLGVVLQNRQSAGSLALEARVAEGRLGALAGASLGLRNWRPQAYYDEPGRGSFARDGGGVLISQGIHTLDLMLSLAGPVAEVTGYATTTPVHRMETEDMVAAAARFANGAFGTIDATTAAYPGFAERIELACEKGTASLVGTELIVQFQDGRRVEIAPDLSPGGTGADPMAFPHDYHRAVMVDFVAAIREARAPKVTGEEALKVHRLIDALIATGRRGAPVAVAGAG
jgi:predicted dehydrogenase